MNRSFRIVFNRARGKYMVANEMTKSVQRGGKCAVVAAVLGALLGASGTALAAQGASTDYDQYVALRVDSVVPASWDAYRSAYRIGDYYYTTQTVTVNGTSYQYYVRRGYAITAPEDSQVKRHTGSANSLVINAYKVSDAYDDVDDPDNGLLIQPQTLSLASDITTLNNKTLSDTTASSYVAVSNSGGVSIPASWNYYIQDSSGNFQDVGGTSSMATHFCAYGSCSELTYDGVYKYNGEVVANENLYVIDGKTGVFLNIDSTKQTLGTVYTGTVLGKNNEVLKTTSDDGKLYSFWGTEYTDPASTISKMTVAELNSAFEKIQQNVVAIHEDDIKQVELSGSDGTATVKLRTNGVSGGDGGVEIPGALTLASKGGTNGNDTYLEITQKALTEGGKDVTLKLDTGSKVVATAEDGTLKKLSVNGDEYTVGTMSSFQVNGNGTKVSDVADGDIVNFANGTNTTAEVAESNGTTSVKFNLNDTVNLTSNGSVNVGNGAAVLNNSGLVLSNGAKFTSSGISAGSQKIEGVVAGTADTDAVNVSQLNKAVSAASTEVTVGGVAAGTDGYSTGGNLQLKVSEGEDGQAVYDVKLNNEVDLTDAGKLTVGASTLANTGLTITDGPSVLATGINAGNKKITNVAAGEISENSTDAVNGSQLNEVKAEAGKHTKLTVNDGQEPGNTSGNLLLTKNDQTNTYDVKLADQIALTSNGSFKIGDTLVISGSGVTVGSAALTSTGLAITGGPSVLATGIDAGSKKITNVAAGDISENSTDAVNGSQLHEVKAEAGKHTKLTVNGGQEAGEAKGNLDLAYNETSNTYDVKLSDTVEWKDATGKTTLKLDGTTGTITAEQVSAGNSVLNTDGLVIGTDGLKFTSNGISAAGQKIENVGKGEVSKDSTDAVNGSQLYEVQQAASAHSSVIGDTNIKVATGTNEKGGTEYQLSLADDVNVAKSITVGGGTKITEDTVKTENLALGDTTVKYDSASDRLTYGDQKVATLKDGFTFKGDSGETTAALASEIQFAGGASSTTENNIGVIVSDGKVDIRLSDTVTGIKNITMEGGTTINNNGITINNGPTITNTNIDMGGQQIHNVANGTEPGDAVNVYQLNEVKQGVNSNAHNINKLSDKVNKVGAHAAALAALHPIEYDEEHLVTGSVGFGGYHGRTAMAVGVFVRQTENLLFSLGGSIAAGNDVMGNIGMSYRFGDNASSKYISKENMVTRVNALTEENRDLSAQLASANTKLESDAAVIAQLKDEIAKIKAALKID